MKQSLRCFASFAFSSSPEVPTGLAATTRTMTDAINNAMDLALSRDPM